MIERPRGPAVGNDSRRCARVPEIAQAANDVAVMQAFGRAHWCAYRVIAHLDRPELIPLRSPRRIHVAFAFNVINRMVGGFEPIGNTGYGVARVTLSNAGDGNHMASTVPFGISVYGYGQYTSYWYPGGLNLEIIPQ
jgi:hypothetical protein